MDPHVVKWFEALEYQASVISSLGSMSPLKNEKMWVEVMKSSMEAHLTEHPPPLSLLKQSTFENKASQKPFTFFPNVALVQSPLADLHWPTSLMGFASHPPGKLTAWWPDLVLMHPSQ